MCKELRIDEHENALREAVNNIDLLWMMRSFEEELDRETQDLVDEFKTHRYFPEEIVKAS